MNFMRNIGQSVGTSAVTTFIARRSQYHQSVLAEYTGSGRFHNALTALAMGLTRAGLSAHAARQQALGRLYALVQSQAAVLSYVDAYWLLSMCPALMFVCSFLLKKMNPEGVAASRFTRILGEMWAAWVTFPRQPGASSRSSDACTLFHSAGNHHH